MIRIAAGALRVSTLTATAALTAALTAAAALTACSSGGEVKVPTTSAGTAGTAGTAVAAPRPTSWSKAYARQRLQTMLGDRHVERDNGAIGAELRSATDLSDADLLTGITYNADDAADTERIVAANLGVGHWPDEVAGPVAALRMALTADQLAYADASKQRSVPAFRAKLARVQQQNAAVERAIARLTQALAD